MTYLALDLSKRSTGWALWNPEWRNSGLSWDHFENEEDYMEYLSSARTTAPDVPRYGHWNLGSEWTTEGGVYAKLHRNLSDLYKVEKFTHLYFEEPINPSHLQGGTTAQTIWMLGGLAAHVQSFGHIKRCRMVKAVNVERWRKDFIGDMVVREVKAGTRRARKAGNSKASSTDQLKKLTIERCRQYGFNPRKNDEADAIGILTYAILLDGVTPPWLARETLRPQLVGATA